MSCRRAIIFSGLSLLPAAIAARADAPPVRRQIGSWVLDCSSESSTDRCRLRHMAWVIPPGAGHPGAALEVQRRGALLVPVVTLRGLSTQAAIGGLLALKAQVDLQFDAGQRVPLACRPADEAVVCAPEDAVLAASAAALPTAHMVEVRAMVGVPGGATLPPETRSLDLQGTQEALARLQTAGAAGEAIPAEPGLDMLGFIDKVLRGAGFRNGTAGLLAHIAGR